MGNFAGQFYQGLNSIALGDSAGQNGQGNQSVAIGNAAGSNQQGSGSLALGYIAGFTSQGINAVAIGQSSGSNSQGSGAIAIGSLAGFTSQGNNAIAIGSSAGQTNQSANTIYLCAADTPGSGSYNTSTNGGFFAEPLRSNPTESSNLMYYNPVSKEIFYETSSRAAKFDIEDLHENTSLLLQLQPRTFVYKSSPEFGPQIGLIAEEVAEVHPKFATYNEPEGSPANVNWRALTVFLIAEVKKLRQELDELKTR